MKTLLLIGIAALSAGCAMNEEVESDRVDADLLASELRGYEQAGAPVSCVSLRDLRGNRSAGEGAIIFDGSGRQLWVNRPRDGCPNMRFGHALRINTTMSRLCSGEIVTVFDPVARLDVGSCSVGEFTPYRRTR
ncbi:MAG TPA: DUF6491 family protein [Allosphingosinicella sp.]|jgi:hypothetical protein